MYKHTLHNEMVTNDFVLHLTNHSECERHSHQLGCELISPGGRIKKGVGCRWICGFVRFFLGPGGPLSTCSWSSEPSCEKMSVPVPTCESYTAMYTEICENVTTLSMVKFVLDLQAQGYCAHSARGGIVVEADNGGGKALPSVSQTTAQALTHIVQMALQLKAMRKASFTAAVGHAMTTSIAAVADVPPAVVSIDAVLEIQESARRAGDQTAGVKVYMSIRAAGASLADSIAQR